MRNNYFFYVLEKKNENLNKLIYNWMEQAKQGNTRTSPKWVLIFFKTYS